MANERFHNALNRIPQNVPPVWMMRQAGRYHSHYQNLRKKYTFEELCKEPELAAEVAWGPVEEFDFGLAILFSDILFPLEALGLGLAFTDKGPVLGKHLKQPKDTKKLRSLSDAIGFLGFQKEALRLTRQRIPNEKSIIGFIGGAWTLFVYAMCGRHDGNLSLPKTSDELRMDFFSVLIPLLRENIRLQLEGGAEIVMIFDTAAGDLSPALFRSIVMPFLKDLTEVFPGRLGYYGKSMTEAHLASIDSLPNLAGFGMDHRFDLIKILSGKHSGFVQGNWDQALLFHEPERFESRFRDFLQPVLELGPEDRLGWIAGLGHGVLPGTPERNVKRYVELVREVFS